MAENSGKAEMPGEPSQTKTMSRRDKLQVVEQLLEATKAVRQSANPVRFGMTQPQKTFESEIAEWKAKVANELVPPEFDAIWRNLVDQTATSKVGLDLAEAYLGILKWRLKDRIDDNLGERSETRLATQCWFQIWGYTLVGVGYSSDGIRASFDEQRSFPDLLRNALLYTREWSADQSEEFGALILREVEQIENRSEDQDYAIPYGASAWHIGWSMLALAWLMANTKGECLPMFAGYRTCNFDESQKIRFSFQECGQATCIRCRSELPFQVSSGTSLQPVLTTCKACELIYFFPLQADPKSIWSGPPLKLRATATSSNQETVSSITQPTNNAVGLNSGADAKKVFIIHGRNVRAAGEMANFVRALGLNPIAFNELRANMGGTPNIADIVTRGMDEAQGVIALFTGDEWSELRPELKGEHDKPHDVARWQSRPNVIFEAGMAFGRDRKRVVFVVLGDAELFTDVAGIHVLRLSSNPAGDRDTLRLTLKNMGCSVEDSSAWMTAGDFEGVVMPALGTHSPFGGADNLPTTLVTASDPKILADRHTIKSLADVVNSRWLENFKYGQLMDPKYLRQEELDVLNRYTVLATMPENAFYDQGLRSSHRVFIEAIESYTVISAQERVPKEGDTGSFVLSVKSAGAHAHIVDYDVKLGNQLKQIVSAVNQLWSTWGAYARLAKLFEVGMQTKV